MTKLKRTLAGKFINDVMTFISCVLSCTSHIQVCRDYVTKLKNTNVSEHEGVSLDEVLMLVRPAEVSLSQAVNRHLLLSNM